MTDIKELKKTIDKEFKDIQKVDPSLEPDKSAEVYATRHLNRVEEMIKEDLSELAESGQIESIRKNEVSIRLGAADYEIENGKIPSVRTNLRERYEKIQTEAERLYGSI